jgi:hypothetical protein
MENYLETKKKMDSKYAAIIDFSHLSLKTKIEENESINLLSYHRELSLEYKTILKNFVSFSK